MGAVSDPCKSGFHMVLRLAKPINMPRTASSVFCDVQPRRLIFSANNHETQARVDVDTDGTVQYMAGGALLGRTWKSQTCCTTLFLEKDAKGTKRFGVSKLETTQAVQAHEGPVRQASFLQVE